MDEISPIEWQPGPLPVDGVRPARPTHDKEPPARDGKRSPKKDHEEAEDDTSSRQGDSFQREDEAPEAGPPASPKSKRSENSEDEDEPGSLIDIRV